MQENSILYCLSHSLKICTYNLCEQKVLRRKRALNPSEGLLTPTVKRESSYCDYAAVP
jgi:hypothetical protein